MKNKWIKLVFPLSVILAFALIFGSVSSVFAAPQITAEDLGAPGRGSWHGFGLVNADEAVIAVTDPGDKIPPRTRIQTSGLQGNDGWYRSDVLVELIAADNIGGSGVANTQYSLDGGSTWQNYYEPFTLSNEGINTIQARSQDSFGNMEGIPASSEVKIDKAGPSVDVSVDPSLIWPENHTQVMVDVLVTASAIDDISGLESFQLTVEDEYDRVEPLIGPYLQRQIQLEASREGNDLDGRVYTVSITATDYAGNSATAATTVTVLHDRGEKERNRKHYPLVYDSLGVRDPNLALGEPDGKFAYMTGEGSYLSLQLFTAPKWVEEIHTYYIHQYTWNVGLKFDVEVSLNGVDWIPILTEGREGHYMERAADDVFMFLVGALIKFVRISQWGGAVMGIDTIEVVKGA